MPSAGAPGSGIGSAVYTLLTLVALVQKTASKVRQKFGFNPDGVTLPRWLFKTDIKLQMYAAEEVI